MATCTIANAAEQFLSAAEHKDYIFPIQSFLSCCDRYGYQFVADAVPETNFSKMTPVDKLSFLHFSLFLSDYLVRKVLPAPEQVPTYVEAIEKFAHFLAEKKFLSAEDLEETVGQCAAAAVEVSRGAKAQDLLFGVAESNKAVLGEYDEDDAEANGHDVNAPAGVSGIVEVVEVYGEHMVVCREYTDERLQVLVQPDLLSLLQPGDKMWVFLVEHQGQWIIAQSGCFYPEGGERNNVFKGRVMYSDEEEDYETDFEEEGTAEGGEAEAAEPNEER